jgi:hypothetical protein
MGKFSHALASVARPRLDPEDNASMIWGGIQVAFNNVARSITGVRRRDHVKIEDLLAQAGLESANRMVVKAIAAETWSSFHSDDGGDLAKTTRSAKTGLVEVPFRGGDTYVTHAAHVWNGSASLRLATTKAKAKKAASNFASQSPLFPLTPASKKLLHAAGRCRH